MTDDTKQIAIRLPRALLERLEDHTTHMKEENPGVNVTRADAIRALLIDALDAAETDTSTR